jgi:hypothetical protein
MPSSTTPACRAFRPVPLLHLLVLAEARYLVQATRTPAGQAKRYRDFPVWWVPGLCVNVKRAHRSPQGDCSRGSLLHHPSRLEIQHRGGHPSRDPSRPAACIRCGPPARRARRHGPSLFRAIADGRSVVTAFGDPTSGASSSSPTASGACRRFRGNVSATGVACRQSTSTSVPAWCATRA